MTEGRRIQALSDDDVDNQKLIQQAAGREPRIDLPTEQATLLLTRNSQLTKFITLTAILCHYTEQDDITNSSTSWEWIIDYLRQHYNLESRGEHFLDIVEVTYTSDVPYQTFYKQFRAGFIDNLRKRGERLAYKNNQELTADEVMSPTLEATVVLWALERIDPRLPGKVKKNYGHQMVGNQCLVSLQPTIFQNIGAMLTELDTVDNAFAARCSAQTTECNAINTKRQEKAPRPQMRGRTSQNNKAYSKGFNHSRKFCRICYHAGSSPTVYLSHAISSCSYLTKADKADLKSLSAVQSLSLVETGTRKDAIVAPGWDTDENESGESDNSNDDGINYESYVPSLINNALALQANTLVPQCNLIQPKPSQVLATSFNNKKLPITLDSGATISFIREDIATSLNIPIQPNSQSATLADKCTTIVAIGEINVIVYFQQCPLKLQALVVADLQAPCFGGTNFHVDNHVVPDLKLGTIMIRGQTYQQSNTYWRSGEPEAMKINKHTARSTSSRSLQVKEANVMVPGGEISIPLLEHYDDDQIFITPTFSGADPLEWMGQICQISNNQAQYVNKTRSVLKSPKYAHFQATRAQLVNPGAQEITNKSCSASTPPASIEQMLKLMKINYKRL